MSQQIPPSREPAEPLRAISLIASDLDGTFLDRESKVSTANRDAVLLAANLGIPTIFATGRPVRWLEPLEPVREARPLVITSNGALVFDLYQNEVVMTFGLDLSVTADVIADLHWDMPEATFAVEYAAGWGRDINYPIPTNQADADVVVEHPEELLLRDTPIKLLIRNGAPTMDLMCDVEAVVDHRLQITASWLSSSGFVELSHAGVTKGDTLEYLLAELQIPPYEVAAFGDMLNDLTMLQLVGHPFVMDGAHDVLKDYGFPLCGPHDESAFAKTVFSLLG